MARAIGDDPLHRFRFAVQLEIDGERLGFSRVEIRPNPGPWCGPGRITLEKHLGYEMIALLSKQGPHKILVSVYHATDELGGDDPRLVILLEGCRPAESELGQVILDASDSEILVTSLTMSYESLNFLTEMTPLQQLALCSD